MNLKPEIFRQYDIRGIVGEELTPESVEVLGKGIGTYYRRQNCRQLALGMDCRNSSPIFFTALSKGLRSTGCDVIGIGTVPTPLLYFTIYQKKIEGGVMITGSHNPPEFNGFKMMVGHESLYGEAIQEIYKIILSEDFHEDDEGKE